MHIVLSQYEYIGTCIQKVSTKLLDVPYLYQVMAQQWDSMYWNL